MSPSALRKILYRAGLLKPYWRVDRMRYVKRLAKRKASDWRYVAQDDLAQFADSEVVARLPGAGTPVFFYCNRHASSIEAAILKSSKHAGEQQERWRVLDLGRELILPGSRVIDVGANIGVYALPWAAAHPDVALHCFEPNPAVRERLARNVALNRLAGRIRLHPEALSDRCGTADLYGSDDMSSLNKGVYTGAAGAPTPVALARLDELFDLQGPPVSLVKIDVQGHELEVLSGAKGVVSRYRPALILEHEDALYRSAAEASERKAALSRLLLDLGYQALYISRLGADLMAVVDWARRLNGDLLALPLDAVQGQL